MIQHLPSVEKASHYEAERYGRKKGTIFFWVFSIESDSSMHRAALLFSAPRFTGSRRHALPVLILSFFRHRSTSLRPAQPGSAVSACLRGGTGFFCFRMLVRAPVEAPGIELLGASIFRVACILIARYALAPGFTGMQGPWERQKITALPKLRTSLERTYEISGAPVMAKGSVPSGRTRMHEAAGRVCAGERTWP
jgi:hypothetical protein